MDFSFIKLGLPKSIISKLTAINVKYFKETVFVFIKENSLKRAAETGNTVFIQKSTKQNIVFPRKIFCFGWLEM